MGASSSKTHKDWEAICDGCGKCCIDQYSVGKLVFDKESKCSFHDSEKGCTVYPIRHQMNPKCVKLTPFNIGDWLPDTCAYRKLTMTELLEYAANG